MLRVLREQAEEVGYTLWWWRERASGELVGYVGLNRDEIAGEPAVEIGWSITPSRWDEGFATEAALVSLAWGFERCGLEEIVSFALLDNVRSRRVMEKIGMTYERDFERAGLPHALYRIRSRSPKGEAEVRRC
jgi:ribosomal-protein-alanine N-acetyltransferase